MKKTKNRLGMSAIISHPEKKSIEEQIAIFASVGFESFFLSSGTTDEFKKIPYWSRRAELSGIDFEAVHMPSTLVNSVWDDSAPPKAYQESLEKILGFCSNGEISKLVVHVGTRTDIEITQRGLEFWRNAEEYAKGLGVILCYENANTPLLFEAVLKDAIKPHGFCFDVGHKLCYTPDKDYAKKYGEKLIYTHVHDNFLDGRDLHLLPKDGGGNWEDFFSSLAEVGYLGTLNLELSCSHRQDYRDMPFYTFAEHSYNRLKELIK